MDLDAPPPYTSEQRKNVTYAEVATKLSESINSSELENTLEAFRGFLSSQENVTLTKNQLQVLKSQAVLVLEETAKYLKSRGDGSDILPRVAKIFWNASEKLESLTKWEVVLKGQDGPNRLDAMIDDLFNELEALRMLVKGNDAESTVNQQEFSKAKEVDQRKIAELSAILPTTVSSGTGLTDLVQESMSKELKIIGDRTVSRPFQDPQKNAKHALAILAELTGTALPPSTLLGKEWVTIDSYAIHQGSSYDVFLGEYFTGEKIAIKVLRHRVDQETGKKMHQRFARQAVNWSSLRHDAILPFYGLGLLDSPVVPGEFQLYLVSPYMQNRDVKSYLRRYTKTSRYARLQIALDVARGLCHMHEAVELGEQGHGIVHSALNVYNVLIKDSGRAAISGFGHAKVIKNFQESFTGDNSEYRYMGPELMQDDAHISYGTDIYAWAMTALEILTDVPPFGEKSKGPRIIQKVALGEKPDRLEHPKLEEYACRDEIWSLLRDCWKTDPGLRPTADVVVQRIKPLLHQLGNKNNATEQRPPPPAPRGPTAAEDGKANPGVAQAPPSQH